jgi:dTDP-4-dehydrorhamnose 3,5-epimerase-like enzyme
VTGALRGVKVEAVRAFSDGRGELLKLLPGPVPGEVYLVRARPGVSRGHHLHRAMGEWFTALAGRGILRVVDPESGARADYDLDGARVYVPAGLAHALFNTGDGDYVVLALADRLHDPGDVFPYTVPAPGDQESTP